MNTCQPGLIRGGDEIANVRTEEGMVPSPENFNPDLEFDVDVTDIRACPDPRVILVAPGVRWTSVSSR